MDEKDLDLEHINEIDMECNIADDDDNSFGDNITDRGEPVVMEENRGPVKTGIIIDLSDDDNVKMHRSNESINIPCEKKINSESNINNKLNDSIDYSHINEIDMETTFCEDEDDDLLFNNSHAKLNNDYKPKREYLDFGDEENDYDKDNFESKELVDEDMLEEKRKHRKKVTTGEVEADYWRKMAKKHAATNVKGAYNTHFHIGGDPEKERKLFNHDITVNTQHSAADVVSGGFITGVGSGEAGDGAAVAAAGAGEGCSESLKLTEQYNKKLTDIFDIIGFDIVKNEDGSYTAIDICDRSNLTTYSDIYSLIAGLEVYIQDCFIYPLQFATGEEFNEPKEWINWYNDENKKKYPKINNDIEYCDLLANHLHDCRL